MATGPNQILIKRSDVADNVPSGLSYGEPAINTADGVLYFAQQTNGIPSGDFWEFQGFTNEGFVRSVNGQTGDVTVSGGIQSIAADTGSVDGATAIEFTSSTDGVTFSVNLSGNTATVTLDIEDAISRGLGGAPYTYTVSSGVLNYPSASSNGEFIYNPDVNTLLGNNLSVYKFGNNGEDMREALNFFDNDNLGKIEFVVGSGINRNVLYCHSLSYDGNKLNGKVYETAPTSVTGGNGKTITVYLYPSEVPPSAPRLPSGSTFGTVVTSWNGETGDIVFTEYVESINGETGPYTDLTPYTGILYGGVVSGTPGGTTFDVSAGIGQIVGITMGIAGVTLTRTEVTWGAYTGLTLANIASSDFTHLYIDSNGDIQQQTAVFTHDDYRESIVLGTISHIDRSTIALITNKQNAAYQIGHRLSDLIDVFGPMKKSGLVVAANGSNLSLDRSSGEVFWIGVNYANDPIEPDDEEVTAKTPVDIARIYRDGSGDYTYDTNSFSYYSVVDPGYYDDNSGTLQVVNNNQWTIQRMYMFSNLTDVVLLYYGIEIYTSFSDAVEGIQTEVFEEAEITAQNAVFLGYLIVRGGAADLSLVDDAKILLSGFSRVAGGGAGGGGVGEQGPTGATGADGQSVGYTAGNTPPTGSNTGDFWYENDTGLYYAYVWDGSTLGWLQISGQDGTDGATGATGPVGDYVESFNGVTGAVDTSSLTLHVAGISSDGGITAAGEVNLLDNDLKRANLKDFSEDVNAIGTVTSNTAINFENGNVQTVTVGGNCEFSFSNPPASGKAGTVTLVITNGGAYTTTFAAPVKWPGNVAPSLSSSGIDILSFLTTDGGTNIYGFVGGINFS
jgi:hypothetical protein